jgi:hypothetical protein
MKTLIASLTLAAAIAAVPAAAQTRHRNPLATSFASDSLTVPVMVNSGGLYGARFGTYVALMNPTSHAINVHATLHDSNGIAYTATIALAAGEMKTYENFLDTAFGFSGAGAVRFQSGVEVGGGTDDLFILNAEVYTNGAGRYGTTLPAFDVPASGATSWAPGIVIKPSTRANIGCVDESGAANAITATLFDGSGTEVKTVTLSLPANAWGQAGLDAQVDGGYVRFSPTGAASCYAVVVNNGTNDGRFVPAVEYAP